MTDDTDVDRARALPQIQAACPACGARPGELCTSHNGTRVRRHNTHRARPQPP
ncbi:hypothetical protein [Streptomyces sp. SPB074]|uniref:zinc finger domain-containing protein n=1 Tax=Streptomyces sp. (strain SPB074) TaxID=465543 RepID=UPI000302E156|nr:hypothetical protein [Streptomyces sp. SPB074]